MYEELKTDAETFRCEYSGSGEYNHLLEVKAIEDGLQIDDYVIIPWDWIMAALLAQKVKGKLDLGNATVNITAKGLDILG